MSIQPSTPLLKAKTIGTLLRDARQSCGRSLEECAAAIGVSTQQYEAFELGEQMISLPELELAAFALDIPLDRFWEERSTPTDDIYPRQFSNQVQLMKLRNRMIGAQLRQARLEAGLAPEELGVQAGIEVERLKSYEWGQAAVPLSDLEAMCTILKRSAREFLDQHGPVGEWNARCRAIQAFMELPLDMQVFVSKPVNRPYLELAVRLSDLSVKKLRLLAEGLLEITY